jgi:hypothetical protein
LKTDVDLERETALELCFASDSESDFQVTSKRGNSTIGTLDTISLDFVLAHDKLDLALTGECSVGSSSRPEWRKFVSTVISNCIDSGGDGTCIFILLLEDHKIDTVNSISEKLRVSILHVGQGQRVARYVRKNNIVGEPGWLSG